MTIGSDQLDTYTILSERCGDDGLAGTHVYIETLGDKFRLCRHSTDERGNSETTYYYPATAKDFQ